MNNTLLATQTQVRKPFIILFFVGLAVFCSLAGSMAYGLPTSDSFKFLVAVFFLFYIPGNLLLKNSGVGKVVTGSQIFLSLGVGTVVVPVVYLFFRRYAVPDLVTQSFFAVAAIAWLIFMIRDLTTGKVNFQLTSADLIAMFSLLLFVVLLLHFSHFTDVRLMTDGFNIRNTSLTETIFHQGIVNSLHDSWPPPAIYASGGPDFSAYHLNMHLQIELMQRLFSINSQYLVFFYAPFLYFVLLVSLTYYFVRQIGGGHLLGIVAGMLIFGAGFSFIPGMMNIANPAYPWTLFFVSTIWSLFTLNGIVPAHISLFLCIWFLQVFYTNGSTRLLFLIALLTYGAFGFKSSMGLQIAGVCLITGCLMATRKQDRAIGIKQSIVSLSMLLIMFLDLALTRSGIGDNVIALAPLNLFYRSLNILRMSDVSILFYPLLFVLFLVGALGVRIFGFILLKKIAWKNGEVDWLVVFLVTFVLSGYLLSETIFLGIPQRMNNAGWFYAQSMMGAWFLLFIYLVKSEHGWVRKFFALLLILALAAPTTINFLRLRYDTNYVGFDSDDLTITNYLAHIETDAVVLHPLNRNGPSLASNLAGKLSVLNIFRSFVDSDLIKERATDIWMFFSTQADQKYRSTVLQKYKVNYVYSPPELEKFLDQLPELKKVQSTAKWSLYHVEK